ncbi:MAG: hypothetical protein SP1CHLAM54_10930 [Chlamydiia bacterium]|nr:hypothetical protein [Chlamydiia bacterium]MCH9615998.1 hypothetical protein [Chlamydiia bacterium]MCH9629021.1 hypothetical protein [Chlamydiia bacterium]
MLRYWTVFFLVSFASVGTVCISPALPALSTELGVSDGAVQQLIALYLIGYALGQIPFGPLGDKFGQRRTTLFATGLSVVLAVLCFAALPIKSLGFLIVLRFFLGLSMAVGLKTAFYYIGTYYKGSEIARRLSWVIISFAIGPSVSVFIAGWAVEWLSVTGAFLFQILYCLAGFFIARYLPHDETDHHAEEGGVWRSYKTVLKSPIVVMGGLLMGVATSLVYVFASQSPFVAIDTLGYSPGVFGLCNLSIGAATILGGLLAGSVASRFTRIQLIFFGLSVMTLSSIFMLITFGAGAVNLATLFVPMFCIMFGVAFFQSNSSGFAMMQPLNKSYVSSVLNFINMIIGVLAVQALATFATESVMTMPIIFMIAVAIGYFFVWRLSLKQQSSQ